MPRKRSTLDKVKEAIPDTTIIEISGQPKVTLEYKKPHRGRKSLEEKRADR